MLRLVLGLRVRLVLLGLAGLTAGLAAGGFVLVISLQVAVQSTVDDAALQTARTVRDLVESDQLPAPIPVGGRTSVVQVLDSRGRVLAAAAGSDRLVSLLRPAELAAARRGERLYLRGERAGVDGPLRVVAVPARDGTVVVAAPIGQLESSTRLLRTALLIFFPLLIAVLGLVAWWVIGKTLRPVEALRRGAEEITGAGSATLLPVPEPNDEIRRLAETLNGMLARLESSRSRQRAFVADAAHELRSPLASMRTQLEVAEHLGDWSGAGPDLLFEVHRMSRLVDDLLMLARSERLVRVEPVELGGLVRGIAERFADARVPVSVSGSEDASWVDGDPDALGRVVENLVENAVRHASTRVVVEVGDGLVAVVDDGAGIPESDRERVFDRFTRLDDGRGRDAGGAGLGLAIVRDLVRRHGGDVVLTDAAPGVRAEVRVPGRAEPRP